MKSFLRLTAALKRLPGVGPKQAERLAIYLLRSPGSEADELTAAIRTARSSIHFCPQCWNFTDDVLCPLCGSQDRDHKILCVVEEPQDVSAIERAGTYKGLYHVLHGALSPLDGIGPESLRLKELIERIQNPQSPVSEVILATDPDTEGEATALYISRLLKAFPAIKTTRIAQGVPMGGDLEYIDERTLSQAMTGRTAM
jgi:recombination protein RecR